MYGGGTALFCPSNVYHNAEWPSGVPAGTYVEGDYCRPGWSGIIGRECQANGQWSLTTTGECTRTLLSVRAALPGILRRTLMGAVEQSASWRCLSNRNFLPTNELGRGRRLRYVAQHPRLGRARGGRCDIVRRDVRRQPPPHVQQRRHLGPRPEPLHTYVSRRWWRAGVARCMQAHPT